MRSSLLTTIALALASLTALGVGIGLLGFPVQFYAASQVTLPADVSLMNDLRAYGGGVLGSGVVISLGLFRPGFRLASLTAAGLIYLGFGLARAAAIVVDGMPASSFVLVMWVELIIGAACLALALTARHRPGY